ncbi:Hsp33 family molecular chaperone HslO [Roseburia sp. MUC/MUC-530-WT-4D]|uniref:33 kDa chaperonin n=1 Tax=Roseburia porci TaxID=2605790 RepID=A0A6L5YRB5_9FIRM|nr:Hsp33 family molecular chaperone HslO [Roseburia porci]MST74499.1 Hsp33 family molecular chaperone HslO [Roseburia porci]
MSDYIVRATAADNSIRAFAITSKELVEKARQAHQTSPIMTAALGRLLSGGAMMGTMMKGEKDLLTLQIQCRGPAKGLVVTADSHGNVKGYANNPVVDLPPNAQGKLNVGGALDLGVLSVIKDMGLKEPYVGQCQLQTGEIAEDLTYYFATSEQIPSAVGLGVLVDKDCSVLQAGGFIIQLMPFTSEEVIEKLEKRISEIDSVTQMLEKGMTPEDILEHILGEFGLEINDTIPAQFHCDCSKERISRALSTISKKDLDDIINDGEEIEIKCQFCNRAYKFSIDELKEIRKQ